MVWILNILMIHGGRFGWTDLLCMIQTMLIPFQKAGPVKFKRLLDAWIFDQMIAILSILRESGIFTGLG